MDIPRNKNIIKSLGFVNIQEKNEKESFKMIQACAKTGYQRVDNDDRNLELKGLKEMVWKTEDGIEGKRERDMKDLNLQIEMVKN